MLQVAAVIAKHLYANVNFTCFVTYEKAWVPVGLAHDVRSAMLVHT